MSFTKTTPKISNSKKRPRRIDKSNGALQDTQSEGQAGEVDDSSGGHLKKRKTNQELKCGFDFSTEYKNLCSKVDDVFTIVGEDLENNLFKDVAGYAAARAVLMSMQYDRETMKEEGKSAKLLLALGKHQWHLPRPFQERIIPLGHIAIVEAFNDAETLLHKIVAHHRCCLSALPLPNAYPKHSTFAQDQAGNEASLCELSATEVSLPINHFHPIFVKFTKALDEIDEGSRAWLDAKAAAEYLRGRMLGLKDTCAMRIRCVTNALKKAFASIAVNVALEQTFKDGIDSTDMDFWVQPTIGTSTGSLVLFGEVNLHIGGSGSADIPIVHTYDVFAKGSTLQPEHWRQELRAVKEHRAAGAPVLVLDVQGHLFRVWGAFRDVHKTVVEPLSEVFVAGVRDGHTYFGGPTMTTELARLFYALRVSVQSYIDTPTHQEPHIQGCPGIFKTFQTFEQTPQELTVHYEGVVVEDKMIYHVSLLAPAPKETGLVKVLLHPSYGVEVHQRLHEEGLAPALYGKCEIPYGGVAYLMEFLRDVDGWITLDTWARHLGSETFDKYRSSIENWLRRVVGFLQREQHVHGDLRPANIMIQVNKSSLLPMQALDGGIILKLIDCDWSGKAGEVRYPEDLNTSHGYPGLPGAPIEWNHDRLMFEGWIHANHFRCRTA